MKQRSFYLTLWMLILCALAFTSCSDDDDDDVTVEEGIYVLNNGKMGNNNSTITYYDPVTQASDAPTCMRHRTGKDWEIAVRTYFVKGNTFTWLFTLPTVFQS